MTTITKPNWKAAILGQCPSCGKGSIFKGSITVKANCPSCGHSFKEYETADGPAFFAISGIGTLVGLGAGILEVVHEPPLWVHFAVWTPVVAIGSAIIIRISKTLMIAHQMDLKTRKDHEFDFKK